MPFERTHQHSPAHAAEYSRAGTATYFASSRVRMRLADRYTRVIESVTGRHPGRKASNLRGAN